jgi:hypothetical protein
MARPRSEITRMVMSHISTQPATWLDVARQLGQLRVINPAAPAERMLVRDTVFNAARRGELRRIGVLRVQGARRPMSVFGAAVDVGQEAQHVDVLCRVMHGWGR